MKKIPTLFVRDENDRKHVTSEVTPGCEWVLEGRGDATRKWDGTCTMFDGHEWWARREYKADKTRPSDFWAVEHDPVTGKTVGWERIENSPFAKFHAEALKSAADAPMTFEFRPGTYELVGPKINGNPDDFDGHWLEPHGNERFDLAGPLTYDILRNMFTGMIAEDKWEGLVWRNRETGEMAKLKVKDFK